MDRRYIKLKIKSLIRSIMFGSYYNIKKKEYPKINKIISEVQKYGISQIQDHFTETNPIFIAILCTAVPVRFSSAYC